MLTQNLFLFLPTTEPRAKTIPIYKSSVDFTGGSFVVLHVTLYRFIVHGLAPSYIVVVAVPCSYMEL